MKKFILLILIFSIGCLLVGAAQPAEVKLPSMVFKGKILKLKDIGLFDRIYVNGTEIKSDRIVFSQTGTYTVTVVQGGRELTF
ncbi:MAG: hypothetical protein KAS65_05125, partial [Candidatus Aminicenantes bacterium]|nr:hypothetical protein [Candidatus Aminicenantes bacterium]